MNLYKIWQDVNNNYDTYDSAIVAAETTTQAIHIHPSGSPEPYYETWADVPHIKVQLIGEAVEDTKAGVILASFNAG